MSIPVTYLLASDHSGSTLVGFLLDCHPNVVSLGEVTPPPGWFTPDYLCSCGEPIRDCPFFLAVSERMKERGEAFTPGTWALSFNYRRQLLRRLLGSYSHNPLKRRAQHVMDDVLPFHRGYIRRTRRKNQAFYRAALDVSGASVFCDTTKELHRYYQLTRTPKLDLSVIWLVRDVRAFVYSCQKFGVGAERAAGQWKRYQELAGDLFASTPPDRRVQVRYEDVCREPDETLGSLHEFLGVEPLALPSTVDRNEHHVLGNKMRKESRLEVRYDEAWRGELPESARDAALTIAGGINRELGYSV